MRMRTVLGGLGFAVALALGAFFWFGAQDKKNADARTQPNQAPTGGNNADKSNTDKSKVTIETKDPTELFQLFVNEVREHEALATRERQAFEVAGKAREEKEAAYKAYSAAMDRQREELRKACLAKSDDFTTVRKCIEESKRTLIEANKDRDAQKLWEAANAIRGELFEHSNGLRPYVHLLAALYRSDGSKGKISYYMGDFSIEAPEANYRCSHLRLRQLHLKASSFGQAFVEKATVQAGTKPELKAAIGAYEAAFATFKEAAEKPEVVASCSHADLRNKEKEFETLQQELLDKATCTAGEYARLHTLGREYYRMHDAYYAAYDADRQNGEDFKKAYQGYDEALRKVIVLSQ